METKQLAKHGLIYIIASVITQGVTLLLVPIFTKNMTQEQYGQYNLLITIQSLLALVITLGIHSGMTRFINEFEDKNRTKNITLSFTVVWGTILILLSFCFADSFYQIFLPSDNSGGYYLILIVVSSVLLCFISIYSVYFMMQFKSKQLSLINFFKALAMFLLATYFIAVKKEGVQGALHAQLFAFASVLVFLLYCDRKNIRFILAWKELTMMLKYSIGLLPGSASTWVYTLIDRYFITVMLGLQQVAVYSLGYRIGMMMEPLFIFPFKSIFTSFKYKVYKDTNAKEKMKEIYQYYNFGGWFCVFGFSVFAKPAIIMLSTAEYIDAFMVVPLIVFSYFLFGLGEFYSLGIHLKNRSIVSSYILVVAALVNILFNIILIPLYGIMGAALATVVSYFIMNLLQFIIGKRYYDLGLNFIDPFKGIIIFLSLYGVYYKVSIYSTDLLSQLLMSGILCTLFIFFSIRFGLVKQNVINNLYSQLIYKVGLIKNSK